MKTISFIAPLFMGLFVVPICVMVNKKLYINIKNENPCEKGKVIQHIMKTYALLQCVCWPSVIAIILVFHLLDIMYGIGRAPMVQNFLFGYWFIFVLYRTYLGFNSLIIAVSKYAFIVFGRQTEVFGIPRVRSLLFSCSFGIPIIASIFYALTQPMEQEFLSTFLDEAYTNMTDISKFLNRTELSTNIYESPVYSLANKYLPHDVMYTIRIITDILLVTIHSNIFEGLIYYHISMMLRRYEALLIY